MPEERGTARTAPHSLEAEEGLLGSCLLDPGRDLISSCLEVGLKPEAFYKPAHQVVFQVMLDLYSASVGVDEVSVLDALSSRAVQSIDWLARQQKLTPKDTPLIKLVGGASLLTQLTNRIESVANARYWIEIVHKKWLLRRLIETASHIVDEAYINQDQLDYFLGEAEERILSIQQDGTGNQSLAFKDYIDKAGNMIQAILEGQPLDGLLTGYEDVDKLTFGLQAGQMIVLAARPSMGKTSLGMNIAENVAAPVKAGADPRGILVFSLEMPADQLAMRMLCGRARVNMKRVRERILERDELRRLAEEAAALKKAPIWVDDTSGLNILQLRAKARRMCRQHEVALIVIDYLQLISGTDMRVPREQQISEISRGIKAMAKELKVPVMVLSQLNRASEKENRRPRISDLRESGSIEQDADVVFLLASPPSSEDQPIVPQAARERELIIAKQRNGPTGEVRLTFLPEFTRFESHTAQRVD